MNRASIKFSAALLASKWLLMTVPASAMEMQCDIDESSRVNPAVISSMREAADKGHLYRVDVSGSFIAFQVKHFPFGRVTGRFSEFQGGFALPSGEDEFGQALFVIKTDSMATGDRDVDDYLKSPVFLDTLHYPDIIYVSTDFEWVDETTARVYGDLTIRGTRRPLTLDVEIIKGDRFETGRSHTKTMTASAEIQRSEYGMHKLPLIVSDTVKLSLRIKAIRVGG